MPSTPLDGSRGIRRAPSLDRPRRRTRDVWIGPVSAGAASRRPAHEAGGRVSAGALALVSAVAFAALYALAAGTRAGRGLDEDILNNALEGSALDGLARALVHIVNPVSVSVAVAAILRFAVVRRGRGTATALAVALIGANASAALLKAVLGEADLLAGERARDLGGGFYPSGHATASMSIVLAMVVLAAPGRARAKVALAGGLAAGAVGVSNVVAIAHHASDVVGGFLLATAWVAGTWAIVATHRQSDHGGTAREALVAAMLAAAFGGLGAAVAAALDWPAAPVAGAGGVCAIALLLASAVGSARVARERVSDLPGCATPQTRSLGAGIFDGRKAAGRRMPCSDASFPSGPGQRERDLDRAACVRRFSRERPRRAHRRLRARTDLQREAFHRRLCRAQALTELRRNRRAVLHRRALGRRDA